MIDTAALLTKTGKLSSERVRQLSSDEKGSLLSQTGAESLAEAVYLAHYRTTRGQCEKCGAFTAFKSFTAGYRRFCSAKCSANAQTTKQAREQTCLAEYGTRFASAAKQVQEKVTKTMLERYGVEHHLKRVDILEQRSKTNQQRYGGNAPMSSSAVKEKTRRTNQQRYGGNAPMSSSAVKEKTRRSQLRQWLPAKIERLSTAVSPAFALGDYTSIEAQLSWRCVECGHQFKSHLKYGKTPRCYKCYPAHISKGEQEIADFISSLGFVVEQQNRTLIAPHHLDIVIPERRVCVEFNGIYYHSKHPKNYHLHKTNSVEALGYQLIHIFEDEWRDSREKTQTMLRSKLGVLPKIHARKCRVVALDSAREAAFFNAHHLQGYTKSKVCYGLTFNGELVAAMSFRKPRFTKKVAWELLRYASSATIVGGASRLLAAFEKQHQPESVISYADRRWSCGNLYRALGFDELAPTPPGFYYTDYQRRYNRMRFQKHKLAQQLPTFDPALTEEANMNANGYYRIYDSGHRVFIKQ